jgi:hypothetical protein
MNAAVEKANRGEFVMSVFTEVPPALRYVMKRERDPSLTAMSIGVSPYTFLQLARGGETHAEIGDLRKLAAYYCIALDPPVNDEQAAELRLRIEESKLPEITRHALLHVAEDDYFRAFMVLAELERTEGECG